MKSSVYRNHTLRFLAATLLGLGLLLLPGHSIGQAANACNLLPNPDFELQNVAPLSGATDNVQSPTATHDEVAGWKFSGFAGGSNGHPIYYATNAPTGSFTNPFTNNPTVNFAAPDAYIGDSFPPYQYNSNPAVHNGAISIISIISGNSAPLFREDNISPTSALTLGAGAYYASFQAYRANGNGSTRLGMSFTSSEASVAPMQSSQSLQNAVWTRVAGIVNIPATSTSQWTIALGNFAGGSTGSSNTIRVRYHIDEVELYKIPTAGPPASCNGGRVVIGEGCPIPGATYSWQMNGQQLTATTLQISVGYSGTYTLTVKLPNGTTAPPTSVTVTGCATLPSMPTAGPNKPCTGEYVRIGDATLPDPIPGAVYEWTKKNDPANAFDDAAFTIVYPKVTTTYVLNVYLPDGSSYSSEVTVAACPPPFVTVDNDHPCSGSPITFTAHPGTYVAWRTSPMFSPASRDNSATFTTQATAGTGTVTAFIGYGDDEVAVNKTITIDEAPATPALIQDDPALTGCDFQAFFTIDNFDPSLTYTIVPGRNLTAPNPHPTTNRFRLRTGAAGAGTPALIRRFNITATNNCQISTTATDIPAVFVCEAHLAKLMPVDATNAYPNPASESLTLPAGTTGAVLLNSQGKAVQRPDGTGKLDVHSLPAGLYNLRMEQNGKMVNQHIEVKH